jgi:hypothetical protein
LPWKILRQASTKRRKMAEMADMSDPANIRQALDTTTAAMKVALLLIVLSAGLYLWRHSSFELGMVCLWSAIFVLAALVYRVRKRKLKTL